MNIEAKTVEFLQHCLDELNKGYKDVFSQTGGNINEKTCEDSFQVRYNMTEAGKGYTVAKIFIKQCVIDWGLG
jgi:hypothetical protein